MRLSYGIRAHLLQSLFRYSVSLSRSVGSEPPSEADLSQAAVFMSVDTMNIQVGVQVIFECITGLVIVAVGSYMLFRLIGLAFIGPLLVASACTASPFLLGRKLQESQRATLKATEARIGGINSLIRNARAARLENMEILCAKSILAAREDEIRRMAIHRRLDIMMLLVGKAPCLRPLTLLLDLQLTI
jgi:ATP-binding cassette subfamily C (CFTR/MRP) protein 1